MSAGVCVGCYCPEHEGPRICSEHGAPAGVHPMNVCAHHDGEEV